MVLFHRFVAGVFFIVVTAGAPGAWAEVMVSGQIRAVGLGGIADVPVEALAFTGDGQTTNLVTVTDGSGRFEFPSTAGSWTVTPDVSALNRRGFLGLNPAYFSVSNGPASFSMITRRLDFDHGFHGTCRDELGMPVTLGVRASIVENGQAFETNLVTSANGAFAFYLSPGIWRLESAGLEGGISEHFFPELPAVIEPTSFEDHVDVIAPRVTANLSLVVTNLIGFDVVAETTAFGQRYVWSKTIYSNPTAELLPVFAGVWTVSVRPSGTRVLSRDTGRYEAPASVAVAVTNGTVDVSLSGIPVTPTASRSIYVQVTDLSAAPLSASVYAISETLGAVLSSPSIPTPGGGNPPGVPPGLRLPLADGLWTVSASPSSHTADYLYWQARRRIRVGPTGTTNMTLVLPATGVGPRIHGHVRREGTGEPHVGGYVRLAGSFGETNYYGSVSTDSAGFFSVSVLPGRWSVAVIDGIACDGSSEVTVVGTDDAVVDLIARSPGSATNAVLNVSVVREVGELLDAATVSFVNWAGFNLLEVGGSGPTTVSLGVGMWNVGLFSGAVGYSDPYRPAVALRFQHEGPGQLTLVEPTVSARIEGRLRDSLGRLVTNGYATGWTSVNGTNYVVSGQVSSGYFSLNVVPGVWEVKASASHYPSPGPGSTVGVAAPAGSGAAPTRLYLDPDSQVLHVTGGVARCEFELVERPASVVVSVAVLHEDGTPVYGAMGYLTGVPEGGYRELDEQGRTLFRFAPSTVTISAAWDGTYLPRETLLFPALTADVTAPSNHFILVARSVTKCIAGSVRDDVGRAILVSAVARAVVRGTNYSSVGCAAGGEFCLPAIPGTWDVSLPGRVANDLGYRSPALQSVQVPEGGAVPRVEFRLSRLTDNFRRALWVGAPVLSSGAMPGTGLSLELRADADLFWQVEESADLRAWTPGARVETRNGSALFGVPSSGSGNSRFFRAVALE